ncbi:MAG: hypothetical protein JOZ69_11690 [Myxococcales bacterium]|nr:hypothetical protein [Myxococcales bacterium]
MSTPERPEPREIPWSVIEEACNKVELYRLESLTDEEIEQDLREKGIDPKEGEQILQEVLAKLDGGAAPAAVATEHPPSPAWAGDGKNAPDRGLPDGAPGPVDARRFWGETARGGGPAAVGPGSLPRGWRSSSAWE